LRASATSRPPLRQIRRDRRRFRTTDNRESVRLPSDRPEPCGPGGLGRACCSLAQPRPAPCRLPRSLPASSKAGGPLQGIPLQERCVSPTSATDVHQTSTLRTARFPAAPSPASGLRLMPARPLPSGASLNGEPPASASAATRTFQRDCSREGRPTLRSPGGASIDAPLRRASRSERFQPRTEHAT